MKNLTPEEIERFVEAHNEAVLCANQDTYNNSTVKEHFKRILATVQLDQPRVDLNYIESLVRSDAVYNSMDIEQENEIEEAHRKAIGYTLNDLK